MKKRIVCIITALIMIAPLICGCGKGAAADGTTAEDITTVTEAVTDEITEPETEPVTETTEPETETTEAETELPPEDLGELIGLLPKNSGDMSKDLAIELLRACTGGSEDNSKALAEEYGFTPLFTKNYDKAYSDRSHNCAFAVSKAEGRNRNYYLITIRGTNGGEWYSNVDIAPSRSNDTQYAENFMLCAQDAYLSVKDTFDKDEGCVVIVCGHSRGAAAANLLGVLLDEAYDRANIYVYTFATPATVRGEAAKKEYNNIFNFINENDIVTHLPPEEYGFSRAGKDIILASASSDNKLVGFVSAMFDYAPDIESYYRSKYALNAPGLSDMGVSVYDIMTMLAGVLADGSTGITKLQEITPQSDLFKGITALTGLVGGLPDNMGVEHMPSVYGKLIEKLDKAE